MTGLEHLYGLIEEIACEVECDELHKVHGDSDNSEYSCRNRSCNECHGNALSAAADEIKIETLMMKLEIRLLRALREEDRKAAEWVSGHGGIAECDRKVEASLEVGESYTLLRMKLGELLGRDVEEQLEASDDDLLGEIEGRMLPEGMEWPRFEDEEPVKPDCDFADGAGNTRTCTSVELLRGEEGARDALIHWDEDDPDNALLVCMADGERVKRPEPKVPDLGSKPLREGDVVWSKASGERYRIEKISRFHDGIWAVDDEGNTVFFIPEQLTHRAPVLAADGKPLCVGETVYGLGDHRPYTVVSTVDPVAIMASDKAMIVYRVSGVLTHEPPDSWERLDEDSKLPPMEYCGTILNWVIDPHAVSPLYVEGMASDLVRRAKKLAGVE